MSRYMYLAKQLQWKEGIGELRAEILHGAVAFFITTDKPVRLFVDYVMSGPREDGPDVNLDTSSEHPTIAAAKVAAQEHAGALIAAELTERSLHAIMRDSIVRASGEKRGEDSNRKGGAG